MRKDWFDSDASPRHIDHTAAPMPLPSIIDLARHAHAAGQLADPNPPPAEDHRERSALLWDRETALRDLALTYRARSLSDAAAQLYIGFRVIDDLTNFDELSAKERDSAAVALRRILLSTIPVVAEAAAFDLAEIGADYLPGYADREFPAVEA